MSAANEKLIQASVIDRYTQDNPKAGPQFSAWVDEVAEELGITGFRVRGYVHEFTQGYLDAIDRYSQTQAQRVAELYGATLSLAMSQLHEGLTATKRRALVIGKGEDARVEYYEVPDWPSRATCIKMAIGVHGAEAPKQLEIHSRNENYNVSDMELALKLEELRGQIAAYLPRAGGNTSQVAGGGAHQQHIEGQAGAEGLLLLDDGMHQDGGRASGGRGGPIQAVPEATLHSKSRRRPAKRTSQSDGKK